MWISYPHFVSPCPGACSRTHSPGLPPAHGLVTPRLINIGRLPGRSMETLLLTMRGQGLGAPVVPRRLRLVLRPGQGRMILTPTPDVDAACRASMGFAWQSACRLAQRYDQDVFVSILGSAPLHGWSAGASVGLLALTSLLDGPTLDTDFFATGGVIDGQGTWSGGLAGLPKAEAAKEYASQLQMEGCQFFMPPVAAPPRIPDFPIILATDLGSAYARLDFRGYAAVRTRHQKMRQTIVLPTDAVWDPMRPFAVVSGPAGRELPANIEGIQIVTRNAPDSQETTRVELGLRGLVLWRVAWFDDNLEASLPGLFQLACENAVY